MTAIKNKLSRTAAFRVGRRRAVLMFRNGWLGIFNGELDPSVGQASRRATFIRGRIAGRRGGDAPARLAR